MLVRSFCFDPKEILEMAWSKLFSKTAAYGIGNASFVIKASFCRGGYFSDTGAPKGRLTRGDMLQGHVPSCVPTLKAMSHDATFPATRLATLTTASSCKLQRGSHTLATFVATCNFICPRNCFIFPLFKTWFIVSDPSILESVHLSDFVIGSRAGRRTRTFVLDFLRAREHPMSFV